MSWHTGVALLVLGCATSPEQSPCRPVVSVIVPWSASESISNDLVDRMSEAIDTDRVALNLFRVPDIEQIPRLLSALVERGDSIIVGLGRPLLPALRDVGERRRGRPFFWLGWGPAPTNVPSPVRMWWADAESLQEVVADLAAHDTSAGLLTLVGQNVSPRLLSRLQGCGTAVEQHEAGENTLHMSTERQLGVVRRFLVLERPSRAGAYDSGDYVYWAAEGPSETGLGLRAELHTDWSAALRDALEWYFRRDGTPPGPTRDRWLTLELSESGGSSP